MRYELRPVTEQDFDFLWALHERSMRSYIEQTWGWDDADQRARFRQMFDTTSRRIIRCDGVDVGVLGVERSEDELYLELVELDPDHQNRGLGTAIVNDLIAEGRPVRLQVLKANPARRLYERLGFISIGETETHVLMRR